MFVFWGELSAYYGVNRHFFSVPSVIVLCCVGYGTANVRVKQYFGFADLIVPEGGGELAVLFASGVDNGGVKVDEVPAPTNADWWPTFLTFPSEWTDASILQLSYDAVNVSTLVPDEWSATMWRLEGGRWEKLSEIWDAHFLSCADNSTSCATSEWTVFRFDARSIHARNETACEEEEMTVWSCERDGEMEGAGEKLDSWDGCLLFVGNTSAGECLVSDGAVIQCGMGKDKAPQMRWGVQKLFADSAMSAMLYNGNVYRWGAGSGVPTSEKVSLENSLAEKGVDGFSIASSCVLRDGSATCGGSGPYNALRIVSTSNSRGGGASACIIENDLGLRCNGNGFSFGNKFFVPTNTYNESFVDVRALKCLGLCLVYPSTVACTTSTNIGALADSSSYSTPSGFPDLYGTGQNYTNVDGASIAICAFTTSRRLFCNKNYGGSSATPLTVNGVSQWSSFTVLSDWFCGVPATNSRKLICSAHPCHSAPGHYGSCCGNCDGTHGCSIRGSCGSSSLSCEARSQQLAGRDGTWEWDMPSALTDVAGGLRHVLVADAEGQIWAMGSGGSNALGQGTTILSTDPIRVPITNETVRYVVPRDPLVSVLLPRAVLSKDVISLLDASNTGVNIFPNNVAVYRAQIDPVVAGLLVNASAVPSAATVYECERDCSSDVVQYSTYIGPCHFEPGVVNGFASCSFGDLESRFQERPAVRGNLQTTAGPQGISTLSGSRVRISGDLVWLAARAPRTPEVRFWNSANGQSALCRSARWISVSELECVAPAGSGSRVHVTVDSLWRQIGVVNSSTVSYAPPAISTISIQETSSAGGTEFVISGANFGPAPNTPLALSPLVSPPIVLVGNRPCLNLTHESDLRMKCVAPPAYGSQPVIVHVADQFVQGPSIVFSSPRLQAISPLRVLPAVDMEVPFSISGSNFGGISAGLPATVTVGGEACHNVTALSDTLLNCTVQVPRRWQSDVVTLSVDGLSVSSPLLKPLDPPTLLTFSPTTIPTLGNTTVTLQGAGLGLDQADVAYVQFGDVSVDAVFVASDTWTFLAPQGVGSVQLRAVLRTRLSSNAQTIRFASPAVVSVTPSRDLAGPGLREYEVCGSDLGLEAEDMVVTIAGLQCPELHVSDPGRCVVCRNLDVSDGWPNAEDPVRVNVAGSLSPLVPASVFVAHPLPTIASVSPTVAGPLDELSIAGSGFGLSASDLAAVTVGGVACDAVVFLSSTAVRCRIPRDHPLWSSPLPSDGVAEPLDVSISTRVDATASYSIFPSGRGSARAPAFVPWDVRGRRRVGQADRIEIQWRYVLLADEERLANDLDAPPASSFRVTLTSATNERISLAVDRTSSLYTSTSDVSSSNPNNVIDDSLGSLHEVHRTDVNVFARTPYRISIAAVNEFATQSNGSAPSAPVPEACVSNEYLDSANPRSLETWTCEPCPLAAVCAGLEVQNVTARTGFWRVTWLPLAFAECKLSWSCLGVESEPRPNESLVVPTNDDPSFRRPQAIPGASLNPAELESCRIGHRGTLCEQCIDTYYRDVTGQCVACGDVAASRARVAVLALVFATILGAFFISTERSAGSSSSPNVLVLKIVLNHFQSIAIVGAADIAWPTSASDFFTVADSATSFDTDGLSLECLMGSVGKDPFVRAALALYGALPLLLLYAAIFWGLWPYLSVATKFVLSRLPSNLNPSPPQSSPNTMRVERGLGQFGSCPIPDWTQWKRRWKISAVVLGVLLHTPLTKIAFQLLTCRRVTPIRSDGTPDTANAVARLELDLDRSCDDPITVANQYGIAIPVLVLVSLGLPVALLVVLSRYRHRLNVPKIRQIWSFAYEGLRQETYWWEVVVMIRKVLLVAVTVFLAPRGSIIQVTSGLFVVLAALMIHTWTKPFVLDVHNALEFAAIGTSNITLICALYIAARDPDATTSEYYATALLVLANVLLILASCLVALHFSFPYLSARATALCTRNKRIPPTTSPKITRTSRPTLSTGSFDHLNPISSALNTSSNPIK